MYGLDVLTNAPRPITLAGKTYPVRQLKLREWGEFQAWLKAAVPSPVTLAIRSLAEASKDGPVPQSVQDSLFRQAQEESRRWPPKVGSVAWLNAIDGLDGGRAQLIHTILTMGGTKLTEDEASDISFLASETELVAMLAICMYGELSVPKKEGVTTPPSPTIGDGSSTDSTRSTE